MKWHVAVTLVIHFSHVRVLRPYYRCIRHAVLDMQRTTPLHDVAIVNLPCSQFCIEIGFLVVALSNMGITLYISAD